MSPVFAIFAPTAVSSAGTAATAIFGMVGAGAGLAYDAIGMRSPFRITSMMLFGVIIIISGKFKFENKVKYDKNRT